MMEIDLHTNVSLMDVSTWNDNVDDTDALTRKHIPNIEVAEWILRVRAAAPVSKSNTEIDNRKEIHLHIDVIRCNQLLRLLASDLLRRYCVLTFDSNIQKVIDEYERRTIIH